MSNNLIYVKNGFIYGTCNNCKTKNIYLTCIEKKICETCEEDWVIKLDEPNNEECYCTVGEHIVDIKDMWDNFADCKNCTSEKDYKEKIKEQEECYCALDSCYYCKFIMVNATKKNNET